VIAKRAHHASIVVRDLAAARRFYGELLGLPEIDRPDFGFPGAWYQAGDIQLHLIVPPPGVDVGAPPPALSPIAAHLAFEIDDYDAVRAALERAGLPVLGLGPELGQLFVRDPDGNGVELIRPGGRLGRRAGQ
jgi:catechol 2,3-dioxygenase-like lactoylglutathione lyase family enzyme